MTNKNGNIADTITISTINDDITLGYDLSDYVVDTIDISNITTSTSTIDTITLDDTHWADGITWEQIEFEDSMPTVAKIEDMCREYPGLEKAYENFKTVYKMVHQDWQGKQDSDNQQFPF